MDWDILTLGVAIGYWFGFLGGVAVMVFRLGRREE